MKKINHILFQFLALIGFLSGFSACDSPQGSDKAAAQSDLVFQLDPVSGQVTSPMVITNAHDGSGRMFIAEQPGRILVWKDGKVLTEPFLDLTSVVVPLNNEYSEKGLLGLVFHPDYKTNGRFFVYYSTPSSTSGSDHKSVVAEYKVSAANPDEADPQEKRILEVEQPESNHNGGCLAFGPDGMLYISLGDGGGAGDQHGTIGNGQNPEQLLGSILRIDVDKAPDAGLTYAIPADNPFVNKPGRDEIFAHGLRNPWRFSFDATTGRLFCGDVGQNKYEEVDIIEKGRNYGWRAMEGLHPYDENIPQKGAAFVSPIAEYDHSVGISITGGYVYRGKQFAALQGKYVFADWNGRLMYLEEVGNTWNRNLAVLKDGNSDGQTAYRINSFGEDQNGELYIAAQQEVGANNPTGVILKVTLAAKQ